MSNEEKHWSEILIFIVFASMFCFWFLVSFLFFFCWILFGFVSRNWQQIHRIQAWMASRYSYERKFWTPIRNCIKKLAWSRWEPHWGATGLRRHAIVIRILHVPSIRKTSAGCSMIAGISFSVFIWMLTFAHNFHSMKISFVFLSFLWFFVHSFICSFVHSSSSFMFGFIRLYTKSMSLLA